MFSRIASSKHTGAASECIDLQACVIGHRRKTGRTSDFPGFLDGVGFAGLPILFHFRHSRKIRQGADVNSQPSEQRRKLSSFVRIPGSENKLFD